MIHIVTGSTVAVLYKIKHMESRNQPPVWETLPGIHRPEGISVRAGLPLLVTATFLDGGIQLWILLEVQARKVQVVQERCKAFAGGIFVPSLWNSSPRFSPAKVKNLQNFPWFLKCRMLSVQGVSTLHPVLETEASARQAWPEGQDRTRCKQGLPQSKEGFLAGGSSRTGGHGLGAEILTAV